MKSNAAKAVTDFRDQGAIETWIASYIARVIEKDAGELDENATFESFGLDSVSVVGMTGDLGQWLEREIDPVVVYDHPSIRGLAAYLAASR